MDSALKQRLLGAAVLIALAIIFVPMFVGTAPPKQENTTVNLEVPNTPDHKFDKRTLPVEPPSAAAPVAAPAPDTSKPETNKVVTVDTQAPARVDALSGEAVHGGAAPAPAAAPPKPETKPESKPAPKPETPPAAESKPAAAPAAAGRFAVNLGVYADQAHADALVAKAKALGQPAYSEPTDYQGKPALRVRVGPFGDRAAAEAARLKIKQAEPKVPSSVVESTEQAKADAPASALPATRAGGWAVQVGAFKSEAEAAKVRDRLRGGGIAAFVDRNGSGADTLWRVRAGPYADRSGADNARAGIKQKFQLDGLVVTQP
ncbi:MAG TPA: SPOR domain-containing protein [Rudaea sp.]|nr:SPOR domain-containing protein [Rudaea sp.]